MNIVSLYKKFQHDLQYIESEMAKWINSDVPDLTKAANHLLKAGGKRIRPVFVLLSSHFGYYNLEKVKHIAVALELIHMATLVHDDVIDDAETRRGKPTVKSEWDNQIAMYTGDYIFAQALFQATELKSPRIHQILSKAMVVMAEGEIDQIRDLYRIEQSLHHYLRRIKRKTALLIAISCQLGALAAEAEDTVVETLYSYGYNVGMAFQITDDVLDFVSTAEKLGKPVGNDLRQGNVTLPVLYALKHSPIAEEMKKKMTKELMQENSEELIHWVKQSGGIEYSLQLADRYLQKGLAALEILPDNQFRRGLYEIAHFIGKRKY